MASERNAGSRFGSRPHEARHAQKPGSNTMALAPMALRLESCLPRAIISSSGRRRCATCGQLDEPLALGADRGAEPGDDVGDIAELLQDGVVRNGAHARYGLPSIAPRASALPLDGPRSGLEQQVRPEGAEHRAIARMREQLLLVGAQPQPKKSRRRSVSS